MNSEVPLVRRLKVAQIQPSRAVPCPVGTSEGGLPEQVPAAQRCCAHVTRAQLPREPREPTQSSAIGAAPVLSRLLSIKPALKLALLVGKEGIHPKTLNVRKLY